MGFVVKNTTNFGLLDLLCPHTCRGCGQLGAVICECCKKNLLAQRQEICPICKQIVVKSPENVAKIQNIQKIQENPTKLDLNMPKIHNHEELNSKLTLIHRGCRNCESPFWGLWSFGWRENVLEKLVEEYKYQSVRAMSKVLVELYDVILPRELEDIIVVPLPTIARHVRERGFDHTLTLAKKLARKRGWRCEPLLARAADTVQVGSKNADRKTQAAKAYAVNGKVDAQAHYLLVDDVWTTGATMSAAEKVLRAAGAKQISAVVLAISKMKTE